MKTSKNRKNPDISLIFVNFRSVRLLRNSIESLWRNACSDGNIEIIVINNDPSESWAVRALSRRFPVRIIDARENIGFGRAANRAVRHARAPHIGFINPDTEFLSGNLMRIPRIFRKYQDIGVIGARLVSFDLAPEPWSVGEDVSLWQIIRNNIGIPAGKRIWNSGRPGKAGFVSGAALFMKRELFMDIGGFDERFFLYFEDADLCFRVKRAGYRVFSFPGVIFRHEGGSSHVSDLAKKREFYESQERYFAKHRPKWERKALSIMRRVFL